MDITEAAEKPVDQEVSKHGQCYLDTSCGLKNTMLMFMLQQYYVNWRAIKKKKKGQLDGNSM